MRLRSARRAVNKSARALSIAAGLSQNSVAQFEAGARRPRLPTLEALADALHVSPAWLAFGTEFTWQPAVTSHSESLPQRLRRVLDERDLSLRHVDRTAQVATGATRSILLGSTPAIDTVESIAKALAVSPAWLAFGLGPFEPHSRKRPSTAAKSPAPTGEHQEHVE